MIGNVDESNRALLSVSVAKNTSDAGVPITTWVDTAFDGHLVCSSELIEALDLEPLVETEAILADGSKVVLETFLCYLDWFGERIAVQTIAHTGRFPLLGTGLLDERVLHIDYTRKLLTLE